MEQPKNLGGIQQASIGSRIYDYVAGSGSATSANPALAYPSSQTVRFCKFSSVKLTNLIRLLPAESLAAIQSTTHSSDSLTNQMVTCLMIATESSFQVWYVATQGGKQMNCLYCKALPEVSQLDFVHLPDLESVDQELTFGGLDEYRQDREILAQLAPLVAYVTHEDKTQLVFHSLSKEQTVGTIQTTSAIRKFATSVDNPAYKLTLIQLDGTLIVVDLLNMAIQTQFRTFCLEPTLLTSYNLDQALVYQEDGGGAGADMRNVYDGRELRTKTDLLLMSSGFPIDFDLSHNLVAFVYTEINEDSMVESMLKTLDSSSLGQNIYLKEVATKLVHIGHSSLETIGNLLNVNKASTMADRGAASDKQGKPQKQHEEFKCQCRSKKQVSGRLGSGLNLTDSVSLTEASHLSGIASSMQSNAQQRQGGRIHNQIKYTISTENVMQVRIHRLDLEGEFEQVCTIEPPFLKHISLLRFSPSGRHLLIGNESGQYFYVYELWPETGERFNSCSGTCTKLSAQLRFTLFRGFRPALISDCQFLAHGNSEPTKETVVINSLNGTTHVFRLNLIDPTTQPADQAEPLSRVQNLVAACTFKHKQVISSVVDGGRRLLNQISGGLSYEPYGEVRLVSHVFSPLATFDSERALTQQSQSKNKPLATVMTYTSKNELVTFDVKASTTLAANASSAAQATVGDDAALAEEKTMFEMVARSNPNGSNSAVGAPSRALLANATETDRVQLNLQTLKPDNIKELAVVKILQGLEAGSAANTQDNTSSYSNKVLSQFEAETVAQRLVPRFNIDQHTQVLVYEGSQADSIGKMSDLLDLDIYSQVEGLSNMVKSDRVIQEESKVLDFSRLVTDDYFSKPEPAATDSVENSNQQCRLEEAREAFEEIDADEIRQVPKMRAEDVAVLKQSEYLDETVRVSGQRAVELGENGQDGGVERSDDDDEGFELALEEEDEDAVYFDNPYFAEEAKVREPEKDREDQRSILAESLKLSGQSFEHLEAPEKAPAASEQSLQESIAQSQVPKVVYIHAPEPEEEGKNSREARPGQNGDDLIWDLSMDYFAD